MIYLVGDAPTSKAYIMSTWEEFKRWEYPLPSWQLDTETNVTDSIVERELRTIQFGDFQGKDQWVIQWSRLNEEQRSELKQILETKWKLKLIHTAVFEYTILWKYGIELDNVYDTMLVEKVLTTGHRSYVGQYALSGLIKRYLNIDIDKEMQTGFDADVLTEDHVIYAAIDTQHLGKLYRLQVQKLKEENLEYTAALENEAVLGYAEMEYNGMLVDTPAWLANVTLADPIIRDAEESLNSYIKEELREKSIANNFLTDKDTININWNAPKQRQIVLQYLFPDLQGATAPIVKKYIKSRIEGVRSACTEDLPKIAKYEEEYGAGILVKYLEKDFNALNEFLLKEHKEWMIEQGFVIPKDTVLINWNSPVQRLTVFKWVEPHLEDTSKESLVDCDHPIIEAYQEYIVTSKLKSSFGEPWIEKYVDSDGRARTRFNQILNTGRVSSSNPNLQQIPAKENVGNRYRNCFIPTSGYKLVDSDYSSQELFIIASLSNDPVWIDALKKGQDLHSICAELVFGKKWLDAADSDCSYYSLNENGEKSKEKCKCKKHKTQRTAVKTINFGLAYGMSEFRLAGAEKISVLEAKELIDNYFKAFPSIGGLLTNLGRFGVHFGYIMTPAPYYRKRYYDYWAEKRSSEYWMGKVERASKNMPIQGCAADMMKTALVLMRWYIKDHSIRDRVKLVCQVHDQQVTEAREDYADEWRPIMDKLMCDAAKFIIPSGLLTADTQITDKWQK
jgi:DNA polymerase I-like protein with 3'-5' exonuclease and polymerase domains